MRLFDKNATLGWLWTTSTDLSPEGLTLTRLAGCLRWNSWVRVFQTSLRVKCRFSISPAQRETSVSPRSTTPWEENILALVRVTYLRERNRVERLVKVDLIHTAVGLGFDSSILRRDDGLAQFAQRSRQL